MYDWRSNNIFTELKHEAWLLGSWQSTLGHTILCVQTYKWCEARNSVSVQSWRPSQFPLNKRRRTTCKKTYKRMNWHAQPNFLSEKRYFHLMRDSGERKTINWICAAVKWTICITCLNRILRENKYCVAGARETPRSEFSFTIVETCPHVISNRNAFQYTE